MKIPLSKASPGMILAEDVIRSGHILLGASSTLTLDLINILNKHGIQEIEITEPDSAPEPSPSHAIPEISATISTDGLRADIHIKPSGAISAELTVKDLLDTLEQNSICYGIHEEKLQMLVNKWNHAPSEYSIHGVATGSPPPDVSHLHVEMLVKHISQKVHFEKAQNYKAAWMLKEAKIPFQRVAVGDRIARLRYDSSVSQGMTVTGRAIPTDLHEVKKRISIDSDSVAFESEGLYWKSVKEGVAYLVENRLGVLPYTFDGDAELIVSPDHLKAIVVIHPAVEGGNPPSEKLIHEQLSQQGITHGIQEEKLRELCNALARGINPQHPVVIAEATPARQGKNGSIQFLFETETSLKPQENPDGTVDYKHVNLIQSVGKGDTLARLEPPTAGKPGCDIFGNQLPAKDGVAAKLPIGVNTYASEEGDLLIAAADGNVKYNGSTVEVSEGFFVKEDVDFSTGNVVYAKSVIVGGDVKSGFSVECGGDLQVSGTIEDAHVKTGGHVLCRYGFMGQGKGVIEAHGDVNLSFLKNQTIRAGGSIIVAREALNGTLFSRRSITIGGNPLSVAGGFLIARDQIVVRSAGNASGIKTVLEIGTDFTLIEELHKTEATIAEIEGVLLKLEKTNEQYTRAYKMKKLPAKDEAICKKVQTTIVQYKKEISSLEKRKELIQRNMYNDEAVVRIEHSAMPGTIIKIGERQHFIREEVIGPKIVRLIRHEIKIM